MIHVCMYMLRVRSTVEGVILGQTVVSDSDGRVSLTKATTTAKPK